MQRSLGCCYYPEHWNKSLWKEDARRMAEIGLSWVRIGEFAWSRLEPHPGQYEFEWLDEIIQILGEAGLQVVLGTPTATPPRWMVDKHPDMIALDSDGKPRKFGSRRHYCFSHEGYKSECAIIVNKLAKRYGQNAYVAAWQTDNEYGCHDTTISYSDSARIAFQNWCRSYYAGPDNNGDIEALNAAWGNVFWSMIYDDFDQINLPNLTVTEPNPAHSLAFRKFASDQVVSFNKLQADIIRAHSSAPIAHNYMGRITDFDHFNVGKDLDIASWDSYPLGFLADRAGASQDDQRQYMRQGDPDFQAFHHDLYRTVGKGRLWVMEQQPGPVNWAPYNPDPLPGMVRLWTWEAFAHGAESVLYFRWRQFPAAQEQLHAGLLRPDNVESAVCDEVRTVKDEIKAAQNVSTAKADAAVIFDYDADAAWSIQPHNDATSYFGLVMDHYRALRRLGLSIDILPADASLQDYDLIVVPGLIFMPDAFKENLAQLNAQIIIGPRAGARIDMFQIPDPLPPALPQMDVSVVRLDSYRTDKPIALVEAGHAVNYREILETSETPILSNTDGEPVAVQKDSITYIAAMLDDAALDYLYAKTCDAAGLDSYKMPDGVRRRKTETEEFWFNYSAQDQTTPYGKIAPAGIIRRSLNLEE